MILGKRYGLLVALLGFAFPIPLTQAQKATSASLPSPAHNATSDIATLTSLQTRLSNHISQPRFAAAHWGVKISSLDSGKTWFEHNAGKYFIPASNTKLFTGALALDKFGPAFRIRTSLYASAPPDAEGTIQGDLIIYGRGDSSFSPRFHKGDSLEALQSLVDTLITAGVKRIEGDLVGDESFLRADAFGAGWAWDDFDYYYSAEVSALSINDNVIDVSLKPGKTSGMPCHITINPATSLISLSNFTVTATNGAKRNIRLHRPLGQNVIFISGQLPLDDRGYSDSITCHHPAMFFVDLFRQALTTRNVTVGGRLRALSWRDREIHPFDISKVVEIGFLESPPLSALLKEMLKPSQNLHAQLLLLQTGARTKLTRDNVSADEAGMAEMRSFLSRAGISTGVLFEEGSGLSRRHLVTPAATVALLRHMHAHPWAGVFREALPVAGVDGTLRNRMRETAAAGNARAKTGTLRYVNALSGYVTTAAEERLAFALYLNNYNGSKGSDSLDAVVGMLAEFSGKP